MLKVHCGTRITEMRYKNNFDHKHYIQPINTSNMQQIETEYIMQYRK